jgi:hypothetical protein
MRFLAPFKVVLLEGCSVWRRMVIHPLPPIKMGKDGKVKVRTASSSPRQR